MKLSLNYNKLLASVNGTLYYMHKNTIELRDIIFDSQ